MAAIKSEYYRFNGANWELFYFKTSMDMVDGLTAALANKAPIESPTFNGAVSCGTLNAYGDITSQYGSIAAAQFFCSTLSAEGPVSALYFQGPIAYQSTAPTSVSGSGLSFYVGTTDPSTKYAGWVYIII